MGRLRCDPSTTDPVQVRPCEVLRYTLTGSNSGDSRLRTPRIRDSLPPSLQLVRLSAQATPAAALLYSADGQVTGADALAAGQQLSVTADARVNGANCPALP